MEVGNRIPTTQLGHIHPRYPDHYVKPRRYCSVEASFSSAQNDLKDMMSLPLLGLAFSSHRASQVRSVLVAHGRLQTSVTPTDLYAALVHRTHCTTRRVPLRQKKNNKQLILVA